jgi:PhnB protein
MLMATSTPSHIPPGLGPVVPQLVVAGAQKAIDLYARAFGAELLHAMPGPKGSIMHAAIKIGDATLFLSDSSEFAQPTSANNFIYVRDVDAVYARATDAGLKVLSPLANMFWGDRWALLADPFGNQWQIATHVENVTPEEMQKRVASLPK